MKPTDEELARIRAAMTRADDATDLVLDVALVAAWDIIATLVLERAAKALAGASIDVASDAVAIIEDLLKE